MMSPILLFSYLVVEFLFKKWVSRNRYGFPNQKKKNKHAQKQATQEFFSKYSSALLFHVFLFFFILPVPNAFEKIDFFNHRNHLLLVFLVHPTKTNFFFKLQKGFC
jgi:hypothetical protein